VNLALELAKREQNLVELVVARRLGRAGRGRRLGRIRLACEQRAAQRVTEMNEEIVVLDHGIHVGQERSLPLLLLGEPALDQGRVVIGFLVSHAVPRSSRVAQKTERVPSLGMLLKVASGREKTRRRPRGGLRPSPLA